MVDKIKKLIQLPTGNILNQIIRSVFAGGVSFVGDFGTLVILTELFGLYYMFSACLGFLIGLTSNYYLCRSWVFNQRKIKNATQEYLIFTVIAVISLLLNLGLIWSVTELAHFHYTFSKIIATGVIFFWNFALKKYLLF